MSKNLATDFPAFLGDKVSAMASSKALTAETNFPKQESQVDHTGGFSVSSIKTLCFMPLNTRLRVAEHWKIPKYYI